MEVHRVEVGMPDESRVDILEPLNGFSAWRTMMPKRVSSAVSNAGLTNASAGDLCYNVYPFSSAVNI
ncbi:hypothetical protein FOQG_19089 [Fusarium oxysporum f. sp. raphani 54005]|uniref:Uncharacterized protein n=1 Tax=Fusarium oxysporum f. sp. raphani 54005 TaxID=1089458 RepID=X0B322_FUSOX|nr:hypothetical protein FOQG_19089 [Fusarium oxysporum f. sp. raphani 54005]